MNKFFATFFSLILLVLAGFVSSADGVESSSAQSYGINFPIVELGNCGSVDECYAFCESPENKNACIDFAKKKGFYKVSIFAAAKEALGCDSENTCKEICGQQKNWERCGEFAKKYRLGGGQTSPNKEEMLEKAKQFLGCTVYEECKTLCFRAENREKCSQFSRIIATQSGQVEHSDQAYCTRYPEKCRDLNTGASGQSVPDKDYCRNLQESLGSSSAIPEAIRLNYQRYCLPNNPNVPAPTSSFPPITRDEYCRIYPEKCKLLTPAPKPIYDMEAKCRSYAGCTWTGSNCQCSPTTATGGSTVKGISTGEGILQNILHWLGF